MNDASLDTAQPAATLTFNGFGGLKLAADAYGSPDNPAVLLLHSGGQTRRSWRTAAKSLAGAGRYVLAMDLRGHGDSAWAADGRYDIEAYAEDVRAVLSQLQTRPVVVGASFGGLIALAALGDGGESLASGLVLVDAAPGMDAEGSARVGAILRRHADGFETLEDASKGAQELSPREGAPPAPESLRPHLRQEADGRYYWRWDPKFIGGFDMNNMAPVEAAAAKLTLPILSIHGEASPIVRDDAVGRLRELLPAAEFVEIEGAGHLVASDSIDAFNASLIEFLERRVPREPICFEAGADSRTLRDALGCFGTGVIIACTLTDDGKPVGLTANSFTSVSLDPPLILFCVATGASSLEAFDKAQSFSVNVLHIGQQPTSQRFAKRGEERFEVTPWETWDTGVPIISGSLASIECDREARYDAGDHVIYIGRVRRARFEPRRDPLLYFRGKYRRLHLV